MDADTPQALPPRPPQDIPAAPAPAADPVAHQAPETTTAEGDGQPAPPPPPPLEAAGTDPVTAQAQTPTAGEQVATPTPPPPDQAPSQEKAAAPAGEAGKQLPAPLPQEEQAGGAAGEASSAHKAEEEKESKAVVQAGSARKKPARRLWDILRVAVRLLFHRSKGAAPAPPGDQQTAPPPEGKGTETTKPAETDGDKKLASPKEEGEEEKKPRSAVAETKTEPASGEGKEKEKESLEPEKKLTDGKQQQEDKPHPKWEEEEKRLEYILEEAFTKLLATEYTSQLKPIKRKCLLTFSVFKLASEVKKQAMIYWWVAEFRLPHRRSDPPKPAKNSATDSRKQWKIPGPRKATAPAARTDSPAPAKSEATGGDNGKRLDAEGVISELSDLGFLEPIKNYCCGGIHGCKVNPLVHWMVKRLARDDRFADLDDDGNPNKEQSTSGILCLTIGCRDKLHGMRMAELEAGTPSTEGQEEAKESTQAGKKQSRAPSNKGPTETAEKMGIKSPKDANKNKETRATSQTKQVEVWESTQGQKITQTTTHSEDANVVEFKDKRVILNVDAHVYPLSKSLFKHLSDCLVMLQLGRWRHHDDKTYMEVAGLETDAINKLKNLRYLSLRGLSRLSKLPCGINMLKNLEILDMRGCQNLVTISKDISSLKHLTHLDLTECYMLEHISKEITSLLDLQVFKGFVFGSGIKGSKRCRIYDLKKLKKLQKLTINITTDANIGKSEMAELKHLNTLQTLTITWSEIPSILEDARENNNKKREELLKTWTNFELPHGLEKLDLRCYPKERLDLKTPDSLKKLYLRGGEVEKIIHAPKFITVLRLRYLKKLDMTWKNIVSISEHIEHVEIRVKDERLLDMVVLDEDDKKVLQKEIAEKPKLSEKIKIRDFVLDYHGVWIKDKKEQVNKCTSKGNEDANTQNKSQGASKKSKVPGSSSGPSEAPSINDDAIPNTNKVLDKPRKLDSDGDDTSNTQAGNKDQDELQEKEDVN